MQDQLSIIKSWLGSGSLNLFGRPFAGKDTQGKILVESLGGVLLGGGDILRSYPNQSRIEAYMQAGDLIPSDFYFEIVVPFLAQAEFAGKPLILSAVGRLQGEETIILQATHDSGHPIKAVIVLELSEDEVWKRFDIAQQQHDRGTRADDSREALTNRLEKYRTKTVPVIEFYRQQGLLIEIDGTLSRSAVTQEIYDQLLARANHQS